MVDNADLIARALEAMESMGDSPLAKSTDRSDGSAYIHQPGAGVIARGLPHPVARFVCRAHELLPELVAALETAETAALVARANRVRITGELGQTRLRIVAALTELVHHGDLTLAGRHVLQSILDTHAPDVADEVIHRHTGPVGSRMPEGPAGSVVSGDSDG